LNLIDLSIKRPVTVLMLLVMILVLGVTGYQSLSISLYPKINAPIAAVTTTYQGVAAQDIESLVSKPLEDEMGSLEGIKKISSTSSDSLSLILLEFEYGKDMDVAVNDIQKIVNRVKGTLPDDIDEPQVMKFDPGASAILTISITGGDQISVRQLAENELKDRLQQVRGVGSLNISGGLKREVQVNLDRSRLYAYGLSMDQIAKQIDLNNKNFPGGRIIEPDKELLVRTVGEYKEVSPIEDIIVGYGDSSPIYLKDIGFVTDGFAEKRSKYRFNGGDAVSVGIVKQEDANTIAVIEKVKEVLDDFKKEYPGLKFTIAFDQSTHIEDSVHGVTEVVKEAIFLIVFIILLFLTNIRSTLIAVISIPAAILSAFFLMNVFGLSINVITLAGMLMGIGRVVDDSIVVLENVFRHMEMGKPRLQAAMDGAKEVGLAVTASTLTTICVYFPLLVMKDMGGEYLRPLSMVVIFTMLSSLLIAITFVPMAASRIIRLKEEHEEKGLLEKITDPWNSFITSLTTGYEGVIKWALTKRKVIASLAVGLFILTILSVPLVGMEFMSKSDQGNMSVSITMAPGTSLEETDKVVSQVEKILQSYPEVEKISTSIGSEGTGSSTGVNEGSLIITLKDKKERKRSVFQICDDLRPKLAKIPGPKNIVVSDEVNEYGMGAPIDVVIKGPELEGLAKIGEEVKDIVASVEGAADARTSWELGNPELHIKVDRERAASFNLTVGQIAQAVYNSVSGQVASEYRITGQRDVDIKLRLQESDRKHPSDLDEVVLTTSSGTQIPLKSVAAVEMSKGPTKVVKEDLRRTISVYAQTMGRPVGDVVKDIEKKLADYKLPQGYEIQFGGDAEQMGETFGEMFKGLGMGIIFIYIILASQFESLIHPITIMISIPLEIIGVFLALFLTGKALSMMGILGIIMLTGIVVSNAILLVNYTIELRHRGIERNQAIIEAGTTRLRPILMTAMGTVISMIPMALALREGTEVFAPMAIAVIGGLITSTFLTLIVVPVIYSAFDDLENMILRLFKRGSKKAQGPLSKTQ